MGLLVGQLNSSTARIVANKVMITGVTVTFNAGSLRYEFQFRVTEELKIEYQRLSPPYVIDLQFGLINCLFSYPTLHPRLYGKLFRFKLVGQYSVISSALATSKAELSATVSVSCIPAEITKMRNRMSDLAILLSFASGTWVSVAYVDTLQNGVIVSTVIFSTRVYEYYDKEPLIDLRINPADLNTFLTRTAEHYTDLKEKLLLNFALEYCVLAKSASPVAQIKFLTLFVALESLVNRLQNHIPQTEKPPRWKSVYECLSSCFYCVRGKRRKPKFLVLKRLRSALDYYRLSDLAGLTDLVPPNGNPNYETIRNDLAHRGDFPSGIDPHSCVVGLIETFQRLLLAILEYRDYYISCLEDYQRRMLD